MRASITVPKMRSCPYKTGVFFVSKKEALFRGQSLLFVLDCSCKYAAQPHPIQFIHEKRSEIKMKKMLALLLALVMVLSLAACASS